MSLSTNPNPFLEISTTVNLPIAQQYLLTIPKFVEGALLPFCPLIFSAINDDKNLSTDQKIKLTTSIANFFGAVSNLIPSTESLDSIADKFEDLAKLPGELLIKSPDILHSLIWPYLAAFDTWAFKSETGQQLKITSVYSHFIFELIVCDSLLGIPENNDNAALRSLKKAHKDALVDFRKYKLFSDTQPIDLHKELFEITNKFSPGPSRGILELSRKNLDNLHEIISQEEQFTAQNSRVIWENDFVFKFAISSLSSASSIFMDLLNSLNLPSMFAPMLRDYELNQALTSTIFDKHGLIEKLLLKTALDDLGKGTSAITLNSFDNLVELMLKVYTHVTLPEIAESAGASLKGLIDMVNFGSKDLSNATEQLISTITEVGAENLSHLSILKTFANHFAESLVEEYVCASGQTCDL